MCRRLQSRQRTADQGRQYIELIEQTSGTFPNLTGGVQNHRCYHCADATCVAVCPTGALFKEDGLTRLDRDACSGCGYCVQSCPYGVPKISDGRSSKCDACASNVGAGGSPWCVTTCPGKALEYGDRDEILAEANTRVAALKDRYPKAQIYGETQAGGLGLILVLPDDPETLNIPADPPPYARRRQSVEKLGAANLDGIDGRHRRRPRRPRCDGSEEPPGGDEGDRGEPQDHGFHRQRRRRARRCLSPTAKRWSSAIGAASASSTR